jgi:hypothetical protein
MPTDSTFQPGIYIGQTVSGYTMQFSATEGGGSRIEVAGVPAGLKVLITNAPGAANHSVVTFRVQDLQGNNLQQAFDLDFWLSDSATGQGVSATPPSGGFTITAGTSLQLKVTGLAGEALSDTTGKLVVNITDTAKTNYFPVCVAPGTGITWIGAQLTAGSYG